MDSVFAYGLRHSTKWLSYMQCVTGKLSSDVICRVSTFKTHALVFNPVIGFFWGVCTGSQFPNEYSTQLNIAAKSEKKYLGSYTERHKSEI